MAKSNEIIDMYAFENKYMLEGYKYIAGCDEAGRGPMAGPVCSAMVILDPNYKIEGLNDSKQLTEKKREKLYDEIIAHALCYEIELIDSEMVDELNVYRSSQLAMETCIQRSKIKPDFVLTDCMPLTIDVAHLPIVKGDSLSATIAAASILAKVTRDRCMVEYDKLYPEYGFKIHKGYCTKLHKEAIEKYGICPIHRKSFGPVKKILESI